MHLFWHSFWCNCLYYWVVILLHGGIYLVMSTRYIFLSFSPLWLTLVNISELYISTYMLYIWNINVKISSEYILCIIQSTTQQEFCVTVGWSWGMNWVRQKEWIVFNVSSGCPSEKGKQWFWRFISVPAGKDLTGYPVLPILRSYLNVSMCNIWEECVFRMCI